MSRFWDRIQRIIRRFFNIIGKLFYYSVVVIIIVWWLSLAWPNTFGWLVRF